ncbi:hypothetical protein [Methylorubrum suomiense]|uniref:Uncharacterized protein n=1 Tax=Methylorubrum suomiense TaxID=144191 RepID=A0ABQ4V4S2_9HYPH|nr:hypothetical protein [Methylorubrum suomiense]GJE78122.1 hypothetical protein BGCPKDLD_4733 [Methylorubrum suomiense]
MRRRSFLGLLGLGAAAPVLGRVAPLEPVVSPATTRVIDGDSLITGTLRWEDMTANSIRAEKIVIDFGRQTLNIFEDPYDRT